MTDWNEDTLAHAIAREFIREGMPFGIGHPYIAERVAREYLGHPTERCYADGCEQRGITASFVEGTTPVEYVWACREHHDTLESFVGRVARERRKSRRKR